jgi:hypothetical protein
MNRQIYTLAKDFLIIIFIIFVLSSNSMALELKNFISVKVNGNFITMDSLPYVKNDRLLISVRFISEALNAKVNWIKAEGKVEIIKDEKIIELFPDSNLVKLNGKDVSLDVKCEISNNRTMVPVRFIAESLNCSIIWDKQTLSLLVYSDNTEIKPDFIKKRSYSDDDIIWLSRIIYVEAKDLSSDGKLGVANVVLNRTKSDDFPNTVYDVIFDKTWCIQFPPAFKPGFKELIPTGECIVIAKMALEGINNIDNCLYFNDVPFKSKQKDFYKKIDKQYFYY